MAISTYRPMLERAERLMAQGAALPEALDGIPVDVLGMLYVSPRPELPLLGRALPPLPAPEVQRSWTGADGQTLMTQSCAFVKGVAARYESLTGRSLREAKVLDYGCGWGRLTRLLMRWVPASRIWALDPWDESIALCRASALPTHLAQCDYVPESLPVDETGFDLAIAFSVFTHLSENCGRAVLRVLRRHLKPDGVLALTVRPAEYWDIHRFLPGTDRDAVLARHRSDGFAFVPHQRAPVGGEVTYGDTSMTLEYIASRWTEWRIAATDVNAIDPFQVIVYLVPR